MLEMILWWRRGLAALLSQRVSFSLIDVGKVFSAYAGSVFTAYVPGRGHNELVDLLKQTACFAYRGRLCDTIATDVTVLLLRGLKQILGLGLFSVFDLHKMNVSMSWRELARARALEAGGVAVVGAGCSLLPPCPPILLNGYRELVIGTLFIGTTYSASGRLKVSLCLPGIKGLPLFDNCRKDLVRTPRSATCVPDSSKFSPLAHDSLMRSLIDDLHMDPLN
eukprot:1141278-Pelagomonas_calceolata.AAC.2